MASSTPRAPCSHGLAGTPRTGRRARASSRTRSSRSSRSCRGAQRHRGRRHRGGRLRRGRPGHRRLRASPVLAQRAAARGSRGRSPCRSSSTTTPTRPCGPSTGSGQAGREPPRHGQPRHRHRWRHRARRARHPRALRHRGRVRAHAGGARRHPLRVREQGLLGAVRLGQRAGARGPRADVGRQPGRVRPVRPGRGAAEDLTGPLVTEAARDGDSWPASCSPRSAGGSASAWPTSRPRSTRARSSSGVG